jgi:hypothetical protein
MLGEFSAANLIGVAMIFLLGILGMKVFKNIVLQLMSFLIPILVAASLAGFLDLVQTAVVLVFVVALIVIALVALLIYGVIQQIRGMVARRVAQ